MSLAAEPDRPLLVEGILLAERPLDDDLLDGHDKVALLDEGVVDDSVDDGQAAGVEIEDVAVEAFAFAAAAIWGGTAVAIEAMAGLCRGPVPLFDAIG